MNDYLVKNDHKKKENKKLTVILQLGIKRWVFVCKIQCQQYNCPAFIWKKKVIKSQMTNKESGSGTNIITCLLIQYNLRNISNNEIF